MIRTWPVKSWRADEDTTPRRFLDLQARLGNIQRIDTFLLKVSAEGGYAAADNDGIVRAAALLPRERATDLLARIIRRNAPTHLAACAALLRGCVEASPGPIGDSAALGKALAQALPAQPVKPEPQIGWSRPETPTPQFAVDLVTALSIVDAGLAATAVCALPAQPGMYDPDGVLVPAALHFAKRRVTADWPAVGQLRDAAIAHLQARIALPLKPAADWARHNSLTCGCPDCRDIGAFLLDPTQPQFRFKAAMDRRGHVESSVGKAQCDLDLPTERRGSPHTLIATKNQASYERRAKQRGQDLRYLGTLEG
jgi:hypothetical protein